MWSAMVIQDSKFRLSANPRQVVWLLENYPRKNWYPSESESESEMFLFDPYQKYIQSNNETILDQGTPTKNCLVANIRAAYYIINNNFFITQAKNT